MTKHPTTLAESCATDPLTCWQVGTRVRLLGCRSTDADLDDRGCLTYKWVQVAGPSVDLAPCTTAPDVNFTPTRPGRLDFELTVTDSHGGRDTALIGCVVHRETLPSVSIVATAPGTAPGQDLGDGLPLNARRSLRVTAPTTVTLTGVVTGAPAGQKFDFLWRQVSGPTVQLSNQADLGVVETTSVTAFVPTTSRVHLFELMVFPLDADGMRTGLLLSRQARVIVDTASSSVPVALGLANPTLIPLTGLDTERTVELDGSSSALVGVLAQSGLPLAYSWRQVAGPRGVIENPYAVQTTFTAPGFEAQSVTHEYLFELTVDVSPPGDRSEPIYLKVTQQGEAARTTGPTVRVFLDGVPVSPVTTLGAGDLHTTVTLPTGVIGGTLTLEQVDGSGNPLDPRVVLQTCPLILTFGGPSSITADGDGPVSLSTSVLGVPIPAIFNPPVAVFLDGTPISGPVLMNGGVVSTSVTLPATATTGGVITIEHVAFDGNQLVPPQVVRTATLVLVTGGPTTINDPGNGTITLDVGVPGTTVWSVITNLGGGLSGLTPSGGVAYGGGGRHGCAASNSRATAGLLDVLLLLALTGLTIGWRRRPR